MNIFRKLALSGIVTISNFNIISMEMDSNAINMVYVSNRAELDHTFTSITSIIENSTPDFNWATAAPDPDPNPEDPIEDQTTRQEGLIFNIIMDEQDFNGSPDESVLKLTKAFYKRCGKDKNKYKINCLAIPKERRDVFSKFESYQYPKSVFLKLFLSRFLPYDRCLYLSNKTICVEDIRKIWNTNLRGYCLGACEHNDDFRIQEDAHFKKMYNSGVLLMDLKMMRECNFENEMEELILSGQDYEDCYLEEDAIREFSQGYLYTGVLKMDPGFNVCDQRIPRDFFGKDVILPKTSREYQRSYASERVDQPTPVIPTSDHQMPFPTMPKSKNKKKMEESTEAENEDYYLERYANSDFSQKYRYSSVLTMDPGFSPPQLFHRGENLTSSPTGSKRESNVSVVSRDLKTPASTVNSYQPSHKMDRMDQWIPNLTIINYYYFSEWASAPWSYNLYQRFEEAGCPDYRDLERDFWIKGRHGSSWSFCEWYKYRKNFLDNVKSSTYIDPSKIIFSPMATPNAINVVYITDRKYFEPTFISLLSVLEKSTPDTKKREEFLNFNIVVDDLNFDGTPDEQMQKLLDAFYVKYPKDQDRHNYGIQFLPIPQRARQYIGQFLSYIWPRSIFLKPYMAELFSAYDRCLYLDGDVACVEDVRSLWNTDMGEHLIAGCDHSIYAQATTCIQKRCNVGVLLMDLKKMREVHLADEIQKLILKNQDGKHGEYIEHLGTVYVEEAAVNDYFAEHPGVWLQIDGGFNACGKGIPYDFVGPNSAQAVAKTITDEDGIVYNLSKQERWRINLAFIHYYYWGKNSTKPWEKNHVSLYEMAGCPDYNDLDNDFWKNEWQRNPWSFWVWYQYYKKFEAVKNPALSTTTPATTAVAPVSVQKQDAALGLTKPQLANAKRKAEAKTYNSATPMIRYRSKKIPLVFAINDNYAKPAATAIVSALKNANVDTSYEINILHASVNAKNQEILKSLEQKKNDTIVNCVDVNKNLKDPKIEKYMPLMESCRFPKEACFRFFIPELFAQHNKMVYLDADLVVLDDLKKLYDVDISNYYAGVIQDKFLVDNKDFQIDYCRKKLEKTTKDYFNSGVLLLNIEKMRNDNIVNELWEFAHKKAPLTYPDQDVLNAVFEKKVKYLDPRWNVINSGVNPMSIGILHYAGPVKPWSYGQPNSRWRSYYRLTPYYEEGK
ncbi:hypothetical protein FACS189472_05790 [Alphaproteobacteria bacterium]|nr:hypothetical protein FACS189472_05790 [Alphaproteobacteria bacterium]